MCCQYKCTAIYNPKGESGIRWDDPRIGIKWPLIDPSSLVISPKDHDARSLDHWLASPESDTFRY
jgi:dTDP-4-dehydrorhamnose 3,5-epimerase